MTANWTAPKTWATGELITADMLNEQVRDNLEHLKSRPAMVTTRYGAASTSSTSYVDIDSSLDIDLTTTGGNVLIGFTIRNIRNSINGNSVDVRVDVDATDTNLYQTGWISDTGFVAVSGVFMVTGLAPASHSFRLQWVATNGGVVSLPSSGRIHFFAQEV